MDTVNAIPDNIEEIGRPYPRFLPSLLAPIANKAMS
jgi:hypothetical protein